MLCVAFVYVPILVFVYSHRGVQWFSNYNSTKLTAKRCMGKTPRGLCPIGLGLVLGLVFLEKFQMVLSCWSGENCLQDFMLPEEHRGACNGQSRFLDNCVMITYNAIYYLPGAGHCMVSSKHSSPPAIFIEEGKAVREPVKARGHCSSLLWP